MNPVHSYRGASFARWIVKHPVWSITLGLLFVAAPSVGFSRLTTNFTHTSFFYADDPLLLRLESFEKRFGNDEALVVVMHSPSGIFDVESATLLQELTKEMWQVHAVIRVDSLANFNWVHADGDDIAVEPLIPADRPLTPDLLAARRTVALEHEALPDYLVSKDGTVAMLYARIKPALDVPTDTEAVMTQTRTLLDSLRRGDHEFYVTGGPAVNFAFKESSNGDLRALLPFLYLMVILFLVVSFRRVEGVLLPLLVISFAVVFTMGIAGLIGVEIGTVTSILPQVLVAIGVANTVHILNSHFSATRAGMEKKRAAEYALSRNFVPTLLTSITTAAGFFSFVTASLKPVLGLGILAGIGTVAAWLFSFLLLGGLISIVPAPAPRAGSNVDSSDHGAVVQSWAYRYADWLRVNRRWLIAGFSLLGVVAMGLTLTNRVNSDPYRYFRSGYPLRDAQEFVLSHLGGVAGFELTIDSGKEEGVKDPAFLRAVERFETEVQNIDGITKAVSVVDIVRQTNRSLHGDDPASYVIPDTQSAVAQALLLYTMSLPQGMDVNDRISIRNDAIRVTLISTISDSARWVNVQHELERLGKAHGLQVEVNGKNMLYQNMNEYVVVSFLRSLILAVFCISGMLLLFFRSTKLGLVALLPNLIPLIFGGALLRVLGASLDLGTMLVTSVCMGIAVDDTIHVMTSYHRQRARGVSPRDAIANVMQHVGPALVVTTLVLVAGFGTLSFGTFVPNIYFGLMSASVLSFALVADLTLLPALLMTVDDEAVSSDVSPSYVRDSPVAV